MKKIIIAMAAFAAAFTMTSCNKEQAVDNHAEGNYIVTASTESTLTKTALNGNDTEGYDVFWSEGDTFKIIDSRGDKVFTLIKGAGTTVGSFTGDIPGIIGNYIAYYPASYDGSSWPTHQIYTEDNIIGSPMKADVRRVREGFQGGKVEFKNVGGILRLTVKGAAKVTNITVYTDDTPDITLDCGNGVDLNNTDGTVFHIAMPEGTHLGTSVLFTTDNGKYCIKTLKSNLVINRSEITPASIKIDEWSNISKAPEGALSGTFTVSAEGKKVFFSKGNLYWNGSVYGFENNQYDINAAGHQSSFFWSNKAEYARAAEWYLDINAPMAFFTNADDVTANPGFTANGQTGLWRTLSKDEWTYLLNRKNGIGEATISGVKGAIIFYDDYDGQTDGLTSIPEGCVFLPAGRDGGVIALYWSSTSSLNPSSYIPTAAALRYEDGAWPPLVVHDGMPEKNTVRLVTDMPDSPAPKFTVTFDMNGKTGTAPNAIDVPYHTTITPKPTDPVVDGFTFWGWYKDKDCTLEWDFAKDIVTSNITLYAKWHISGALFGTFTVNSSGKKVYFAKGNLWYGKTSEKAESATFNFEENQYDYSIAWSVYYKCNVRDEGHISHFMWSKNANVSLAVDYDDPSANYNDVFFTNATQTTPNPNFTVNGQKGLWRAISAEESFYLFNHHRHVWATINGVRGVIIFCDGYSGETEGDFAEIPKDCLFLPAAGSRFGSISSSHNNPSRVSGAGEIGEYFTSTGGGYNGANWSTSPVSIITFDSSSFNPKSVYGRAGAYAVRLVTDVK